MTATGTGRRTVRLGDIASLDLDRVPVVRSREYPIVGVLNAGQGLFRRETISGAETNYAALHRLRAGQLVYRKLTAWEGPITTVPPEFDGTYVSTEFPTFTLDTDEVLPAFMSLVSQRPRFWAEMKALSTGTAERRNRLKPADLLDIVIELPPLDEQRRIVDAMARPAAAIAARETEFDRASDLLSVLREALISEREYPLTAVSELVKDIHAGRSPKCLDRPPQPGEWGVLKVSAVRPGVFRPGEAKTLPADERPFEHAEVRRGDVLTVRASGSTRFVGSICQVDCEPKQLLLSDYHWRLTFDADRVDSAYAVEALSTLEARAQIELAASGSTTAHKLSQSAFRGLEIRLPPHEEQVGIVGQLRTLHQAKRALERELEALRVLRDVLAESMLAGDPHSRQLA